MRTNNRSRELAALAPDTPCALPRRVGHFEESERIADAARELAALAPDVPCPLPRRAGHFEESESIADAARHIGMRRRFASEPVSPRLTPPRLVVLVRDEVHVRLERSAVVGILVVAQQVAQLVGDSYDVRLVSALPQAVEQVQLLKLIVDTTA